MSLPQAKMVMQRLLRWRALRLKYPMQSFGNEG
jgi:hypothetical protein